MRVFVKGLLVLVLLLPSLRCALGLVASTLCTRISCVYIRVWTPNWKHVFREGLEAGLGTAA